MVHGTSQGKVDWRNNRKWTQLLRATDHVARFLGGLGSTHGGGLRWADTVRVIRAYQHHEPLLMDRPTLVRLARDQYGKDGRGPRPH